MLSRLPMQLSDPLISVVVPVRDEGPNIAPLIAEIRAALAHVAHEIVYVDDASLDDTPQRLREAGVVWRRHATGCGQSAAIVTGVRAARGLWIATLDGDGQNDPADIPTLLMRAQAERGPGPLLIAGHRAHRQDSRVKRLSSRIANTARARLLGDDTADTGCGLKLFHREDLLTLPQFDHMHRYLPARRNSAGR
jgi:dolichol-phosphate mannosyltransferase